MKTGNKGEDLDEKVKIWDESVENEEKRVRIKDK